MSERERDVLELFEVYESVLSSLPDKPRYANAVKVIHRVTAELHRLRKIEAAARSLTIDFNGDFFEFNVRLRMLKTELETETDG